MKTAAAEGPLTRVTQDFPTPASSTTELWMGRYRLVSELGRGASGVVYAALDELLGLEVAVKRLSGRAAALGGLAGEVAVSRRVSHPSLCRVHDLAEHAGELFLVMERLRGPTLRALTAAPALPVAEALTLLGQLAGALAALHERGLVHCDVKPENVICEPGRAVLIDFGAAAPIGSRERPRTGSPPYAGPELAQGTPLTPAVDVFALAVLAAELLAASAAGRARLREPAVRATLARGTAASPAERQGGPVELVAALGAACGAAGTGAVDATARRLISAARMVVEPAAAGVDDEASESLRQAFLDDVAQLLAAAGAQARSVDDGLAIVFASGPRAPWTALRAVQMLDLLRRRSPASLTTRVGLTVGRVAEGGPGGQAAPLREAGRLAVLAEPGELRVSRAAGVQLARAFHLEPVPGSDTLRLGARRVRHGRGRLHERDGLLDELVALARALPGSRRSSGILVWGEPGLGKSRLMAELAARLEDVPELRVVADVAQPVWRGASRTTLRRLTTALAGDDVGGHLPAALAGVGGDAAASAWLQAVAPRRPVVLLLDDAHWADDASLDVLESIADGALAAPVLVVLAAQPAYRERRRVGLARLREQRELAPLSPAAAARLVAEAGGAALDPAARASLLAQARGNPFVLEELAAATAAHGPDRPSPLATVAECCTLRLQLLPAERREVLVACAVLGAHVEVGALAALLGRDGADDRCALEHDLAALAGDGWLREAPEDAAAWLFAHESLREAAYAELPVARARRLHAAVAQHLVAAVAGGGARPLLERASHLAASGALQDAARAFGEAGDLAFAAGALADAAHCYDRAQALGRALPVTAQVRRAGCALALGDEAACAAALAAIGRLPRAALPAPELGELVGLEGDLAMARGAWHEARERLAEADRLLAAGPPGATAVRVRARLAWVRGYVLGEPEGMALAHSALALARVVSPAAELLALNALAANQFRFGDWRGRLACNQRCLELARALGDRWRGLTALINLGANHVDVGEAEAGLALLDEALAAARTLRASPSEALVQIDRTHALLALGHFAEAQAAIDTAEWLVLACEQPHLLQEVLHLRGKLAAARGQTALATALVTRAAETADASEARLYAASARRTLAVLHALAGDHEGAAAALGRARALAETSAPEALRTRAAARRVRLLAGADDDADERALLARSLEALGARRDREHLDDPSFLD